MDVLHRELHDRVQHYIHLLLHDANDKQPADQLFIVLFVSMQSVSHCNAVRKVDKGAKPLHCALMEVETEYLHP